MDCYGQLPSENRLGFSRYNRHSETTSPLINPSTNRIDSPNYISKLNSENTNSFLNHHQRNNSPIRYPQHQYPPTSYKIPPNIPLSTPTPTTPLNYYPYNFDANYPPRNYLPRPVSNFSPTPVDQFKNSLERINVNPIEEYYRNTHYNYQQSLSNYGKLNVPKSSYYNHHLGLPSHRTSHIPAPAPTYYSTPRNEFYDPIAGLHQTVRNGFKDNMLSNTYHNIYNYSPPLTSHLERSHYPSPYNPHQSLFPNSYPNFPTYDGKPVNFDYYRSHYSQLNPYPDYQSPSSAQYHLYQQQQQQQQQQQHQHFLQNKHILQHNSSLYHNSYSNSIALSNENLNRQQLELINSPKLSEYNRSKNIDENSQNRLQSLINEELRPLSSNMELRINDVRNNEQKIRSNSLEDLPLELNKNNHDKNEQRAESSISETNTVNDMNSETTVASSPLTGSSVSSYTDSGISGCSNNIDGSNTSDGGSVEDKIDNENNINQINSNNVEGDFNEIKSDKINAKVNIENLNGIDESKSGKEDENDLNAKMKAHSMPSNTSSKENRTINKKDNQLDRITKPFSEHSSSKKNHNERTNLDHHPQIPYKENYNKYSQLPPSRDSIIRYQNDYNIPLKPSRPHSGNWSSYHHYQYQSRLKSYRDDNSQIHNNNNNKNSNKNNIKTKTSENISKNRVLECDFIPSKKSRKKSDFGNFPNDTTELREEIKDIKPLPAFQQAFGSTEIGRFSEIFQNNSPESSYNCSTPFDYNSADNGSPYSWETGDSLEGPHYSNFNRSSLYFNHSENFDRMESLKENYFNSFD